jgi:four helix bundle protein
VATILSYRNIAEGHGRRRRAEYIRFLDIANGSRCELETHIEVCIRLGAIGQKEATAFTARSNRVGRMLTGLRHRLTCSRQ